MPDDIQLAAAFLSFYRHADNLAEDGLIMQRRLDMSNALRHFAANKGRIADDIARLTATFKTLEKATGGQS